MLGHGKGMFYPNISLVNHFPLCIYLHFRNKYRRNNHKSWMKSNINELGKSRHEKLSWIKSIINELGKFGHEKLTFALFICWNMN